MTIRGEMCNLWSWRANSSQSHKVTLLTLTDPAFTNPGSCVHRLDVWVLVVLKITPDVIGHYWMSQTNKSNFLFWSSHNYLPNILCLCHLTCQCNISLAFSAKPTSIIRARQIKRVNVNMMPLTTKAQCDIFCILLYVSIVFSSKNYYFVNCGLDAQRGAVWCWITHYVSNDDWFTTWWWWQTKLLVLSVHC